MLPPTQVEAFEKELAVDEAGEVDELESDEEGGKPGTLSDGGCAAYSPTPPSTQRFGDAV